MGNFDWFFGGVAATLAYFFGEQIPQIVTFLLVLVVADFLLGVTQAIREKVVNSSTGINGVIKKGIYFIIIGVGHLFDEAMLSSTEAPIVMSIFTLLFIATEFISLLEHAAYFGVPIPKRVLNMLEKIKEENS